MAELSSHTTDPRPTIGRSRPRVALPGQTLPAAVGALTNPVMVVVFILTLLQPFRLFLGPLLLNAHRGLLLLVAVPVFVAVLRGKAGRFILPDVLVVSFTLWTLVCILNGQGVNMDSIVLWGSQTALEAMVPYFLARTIIRTKADLVFLSRCVVISILVLLPFAVIESVLRVSPLISLYNKLPGLYIYPNVQYPPRLGMARAQSVFEHPILFGLYCTLGFSFSILSLRAIGIGVFGRTWRAIGTVAGTFFSLSSGALAATVVQIGLLLYDIVLRFVKARWKLILWFSIAGYMVLLLLIDSNPLLYIISKATFSGHTAWARVAMFDYGMAEVARNPILGLGFFSDWIRPAWMHATSIDNFWLLIAMRYGIPGFLMCLGIFLAMMWLIWRRNFLDNPDMATLRKAYLFTLSGLFLTLATVHVWGSPYVLVIFLIGAGGAFLNPDADPGHTAVPSGEAPQRQPRRSTQRPTPQDAPSTPVPDTPQSAGDTKTVYTRFPRGQKPGDTGSRHRRDRS